MTCWSTYSFMRSGSRAEAQVGALDARVVPKVGRRSFERVEAAFHDVGPIREVQRMVHVLLDEQDGQALRLELLDDLEDVLDQHGGKAEGWLVEDEQARL